MNGTLLKIGAVAAILLSTPAHAQESPIATYFAYLTAAFFELLKSLRELSTSAKIAIVASLALGAVLLYLRTRDTAANNIRRARNLHKRAVEMHERGNEEEAVKYYEIASHYRQKGAEQQ